MKKNINFIKPLIILSILLIFSACMFLINTRGLFVDESAYFSIIKNLINNNYSSSILSTATALPGYSIVISQVARAIHQKDYASLRIISLVLSLLSLIIYYLIIKIKYKKNFFIFTLQYLFFPLNFIFYFLLYTDIFSLLFILISLYFLFNKKYFLSGIFGLINFLIRQDSIFFFLFNFMCIFLQNISYKDYLHNLAFTILKKTWIYLLGFIVFLLYIIFNHGIAVYSSHNIEHPISLHIENIFVLLFFTSIIFLPLFISNYKNLIRCMNKHSLLVSFLMIFLLFLYSVFFHASNPFNNPDYFLRNKIIHLAESNNSISKITFYFIVLFGLLSICVTKFEKKLYYVIYPIGFAALSLEWLVEPRYYIGFLTLFLLFRKKENKLVEISLLIWFTCLSAFVFWGTLNNLFFL